MRSPVTELPPDPVHTADQPPSPEATADYTRDLGDSGILRALFHTSQGTISCELFEKQTPLTVANFVGLARGLKAFVDPQTDRSITGVPYFNGQRFHRVIPNFLIQSGDPTGLGYAGPGYTIPDEIREDLRHDGPGVLSMANLGPDTGGSQFFITEIAAPHLDGRHTVFGQCEDLEVIRAISHAPTDVNNRPAEPITLDRVLIERAPL
ncbi:peptidylprolyl isomerase [Lujinxingia litoralis]|uniref:peptidylprolyl isomerase n=1 Tax=Lujinxingia litoralis TaxID=2211119 RepID=UPI001F205197|nr:peptidylprolyl isomerase [Lujinxingia litoralis]